MMKCCLSLGEEELGRECLRMLLDVEVERADVWEFGSLGGGSGWLSDGQDVPYESKRSTPKRVTEEVGWWLPSLTPLPWI